MAATSDSARRTIRGGSAASNGAESNKLPTRSLDKGYSSDGGAGDWTLTQLLFVYHRARDERARERKANTTSTNWQVVRGLQEAATTSKDHLDHDHQGPCSHGTVDDSPDPDYIPHDEEEHDDDSLFDAMVALVDEAEDGEEGSSTTASSNSRSKADARLGVQLMYMLLLRQHLVQAGHKLASGKTPPVLPQAALSCALPVATWDVKALLRTVQHVPGVDTVLEPAKGSPTMPLAALFDLTRGESAMAKFWKECTSAQRVKTPGQVILFTGAGWRVPYEKSVVYRLRLSEVGKVNRNVSFKGGVRTLRPVPGSPLSSGALGADAYMSCIQGQYDQGSIPVHDPKALGWDVCWLDGGVNLPGCGIRSIAGVESETFVWLHDYYEVVHCGTLKTPPDITAALANLCHTTARSPHLVVFQTHAAKLGEVRTLLFSLRPSPYPTLPYPTQPSPTPPPLSLKAPYHRVASLTLTSVPPPSLPSLSTSTPYLAISQGAAGLCEASGLLQSGRRCIPLYCKRGRPVERCVRGWGKGVAERALLAAVLCLPRVHGLLLQLLLLLLLLLL